MSSQIEGTQCTLEDVLDPELDANTNMDVSDVINYVKAAQFALDRLASYPSVIGCSGKRTKFSWKGCGDKRKTPANSVAVKTGSDLLVVR